MTCTSTKDFSGDQIKKDTTGGACGRPNEEGT